MDYEIGQIDQMICDLMNTKTGYMGRKDAYSEAKAFKLQFLINQLNDYRRFLMGKDKPFITSVPLFEIPLDFDPTKPTPLPIKKVSKEEFRNRYEENGDN